MTSMKHECGPFKSIGEPLLKTPAKRMTPKSDFLLGLEERQRKALEERQQKRAQKKAQRRPKATVTALVTVPNLLRRQAD